MSRARPIYHLAAESELLAGARNGSYSPDGLAIDGFVHCSGSREIALAVAADYFAELAEPLYVLEIDPRRLRHELRFEAAAPAARAARSHLARADRFPHVYGPLELAAITGAGRLGGRGAARAWPESLQPLDHWVSLGPIELAAHDPGWLQCAAYERGRIEAAWGPELVALHHVGSTSIPGARAKPIVDLLAVVRDVRRLDSLDRALEARGYLPRGEYGTPGRRFFWKSEAGVRAVNLHAFALGHAEIARMQRFRDHLRVHPDEVRAYDGLKQSLAVRYRRDVESYTHGKSEFIESILRKADAARQAP